MIDNVQSLKDKAKNFAHKNNLEVQQVLQNYMFERFLERLSKSEYKDNFILKGGFLLSSIMGIDIRTTMDIDANITGMDFSEDEILKLVQTIKHRNSIDELNSYKKIISEIAKSNLITERWTSYQNRFSYAKNVTFDDVINSINKIYIEVIK